MMSLQERIDTMVRLGEILSSSDNAELNDIKIKAEQYNPWFTQKYINQSIRAISEEFLHRDKLREWVQKHPINDDKRKNIGLVLAGNIPMVGFHDILCCFVAGHKSILKYSEKDKILSPFLIDLTMRINPAAAAYFSAQERLKDFDAVIATGSNNSARYFEAYFGKYPHIIRQNRHSVSILTGTESDQDLRNLGEDIFAYFGLGCRNVSKLYVPENYDFFKLLGILEEWNEEMTHHTKYFNNFEYNTAILLLNKIAFLSNGSVLIKEDRALSSPISVLHYELYNNEVELNFSLDENKNQIQCISSNQKKERYDTVNFGQSQTPSLDQYADGVDTMNFLTGL
jgi:hypothetical protein